MVVIHYECKKCGKKGIVKGSIKKLIKDGCKGIDDNEICGNRDFIIT